MKKISIILLSAILILFILSGCGINPSPDQSQNDGGSSTAVSNETSEIAKSDSTSSLEDEESDITTSLDDVESDITNPSENLDVDSESESEIDSSDSVDVGENVVYVNDKYGFEFLFTSDWNGYTVIDETWDGNMVGTTDTVYPDFEKTGAVIKFRHPSWTQSHIYIDIPILVFTLDQWEAVANDDMAVSAAPIGPSYLGENSKYVFALQARYNFAGDYGYQEIQDLMDSKPLHPTENFE